VRGDSRHDEEHLRRVRADVIGRWAWMEREIESGTVVDSEPARSELLEVLEGHSDRLLEGESVAVGDEKETSKDVERRLEALGYKE
jgi:hypothetical protein